MNEIAVVTEQDIPDILRMIHEIYSELPNKEWFSLDSDEEVTSYMKAVGTYGDCHGKKRIPRTGVTEKDDGRVRTDSERTGISLSAWNGTSGQCGKCEYIPEITV